MQASFTRLISGWFPRTPCLSPERLARSLPMLASRSHKAQHERATGLNGVTVGIKPTSGFASRREKLQLLLVSIRRRYPDRQLRILVADDGGAADREVLRGFGARLLRLPLNAGLSYGRNALVQATRTPFLVLLDDDTVFGRSTVLGTLHRRCASTLKPRWQPGATSICATRTTHTHISMRASTPVRAGRWCGQRWCTRHRRPRVASARTWAPTFSWRGLVRYDVSVETHVKRSSSTRPSTTSCF